MCRWAIICRLVGTNLQREFSIQNPHQKCAHARIFRRKFVPTNLQTSVAAHPVCNPWGRGGGGGGGGGGFGAYNSTANLALG